jgi:hypothetical protein
MSIIKMNPLNQSIGVLAGLAIVATSISLPGGAGAQASLVGQCRAAKQATAIFKEASATSVLVAPLKLNEKVTLAAEAKDGFIAISAPSKGYVQTVNLKACPGAKPTPTPTPTPTPSPSSGTPTEKDLCRYVTQPKGLVIRKQASATSEVVGEAPAESKVMLTTNPPTAKTETDGRIWLEISAPAKGWVSSGFNTPGSGTNLVSCK